MNFSAIAHRPITTVAEMMFHVAAPPPQVRLIVGKFLEDFAGVFADDVSQHVEPATMPHANDDIFHALMTSLFNGEIKQRHQGFTTLERKRFRTEEFCAEKLLENHRVRETRENAELFVAGNLQAVLRTFHPPLKPLPRGQIVNVQKLCADGAAVSVAQALENFADGQRRVVMQRGRIDEGLKVDERLSRLDPRNPLVFYNLACSYSLSGDFDQAANALERALALGYRDFEWLAKDPDLKPLRAHPAFDDIKTKIRQMKAKTR